MKFDASFWALMGFLLFFGLMFYMKIPGMITGMLDKRVKKISDDLESARQLREEAQALLADYERKRKTAEDEASEIVEAAREEATRLTEEAAKSLELLVARRTRAVEDKIAQAEIHAVGEVRARSADIAVEAARIALKGEMAGKGDDIIEQSIKDVAARIN
ncbi:MAG: ATP F0F1 synthase subunit B [Alphaproteobacteria bacterium]|nr:ATP F0F1 synthase subunit B [Alphaproteobacteria bacterium]